MTLSKRPKDAVVETRSYKSIIKASSQTPKRLKPESKLRDLSLQN